MKFIFNYIYSHKYVAYILILFVLFGLSVLIYIFHNIGESQNCYDMVTISDKRERATTESASGTTRNEGQLKFNLISIHKNKEVKNKQIYSLKYPYNGDGYDEGVKGKLRNLIEGKQGNVWYFYNIITPDYKWLYFKIKYSIDSKTIEILDITKKDHGASKGIFVTGIDSTGENILLQMAVFQRIKENSQEHFHFPKMDFSYLPPTGSLLLNDDNLIGQAPTEKRDYLNKHPENVLFMASNDKNKTKFIKEGFFVSTVSYRDDFMTPLGASPDGKEVAFWVLFQGKEHLDLWLSIWNTENNKITKVLIPKGGNQDCLNIKGERFIKWNPKKDLNILAITIDNSLRIVNIKDKTELLIIDNVELQSVRWSEDGRKLGFLTNGVISIYDIYNKTIKKVAEDQDCFDFFWIKRKSILDNTIDSFP